MTAEFKHRFYFLRHGETQWNKINRVQGQMNSQLNDTGREQAKRAGEILATQPIERIVCSPLQRVRDTAAEVARYHDVPVICDNGLKECGLGVWEGKARTEDFLDYWSGASTPDGGETFDEFADRVWEAMARAVALGPNTLIVAHGGLWRAAQRSVAVEPRLDVMPNALPLAVTPSASRWNFEVLGHS